MNPQQAERTLMSAPLPVALILAAVAEERQRQEQLFLEGKLPFRVCDRRTTNGARLPVLIEEFGEVAKAINDGAHSTSGRAHLREELIQLAAVCCAWAEGLTAKTEGPTRDEEAVSAMLRRHGLSATQEEA